VATRRFLAGLDLGGGGVRCLLLDPDAGEVIVAALPCPFGPLPDLPSSSEIDPEHAWAQLGRACREALGRAGAEPAQVIGVAASSMRHGSVILDASGRALMASTNRDARGQAQIARVAQELGEEIQQRTGRWPNPVSAAARLLWVLEHGGPQASPSNTHLSLGDWLGFRLCGVAATDPSQAGETLLLELKSRSWAEDLIERLGFPRSWFPPVLPSGSRLGALSPAAARDLGLPAGIPVAMGGGDTQCALLAAGCVEPGQLGIIAGTSVPLQQVTAEPPANPGGRLWAGHHVVPGRWELESNSGTSGEGLTWFAGLLHPEVDHPEVHFFAEAETSPAGACGMLSTFGTVVMNAREMMMPLGSVTLTWLSAAGDRSRRRHLARAVVEGIAFSQRANFEQLVEATGVRPPSVRVTGGLSRSRFYTQLLADVLELPVEVTRVPEATALCAALCAGVGAGVFADLAEAAERCVALARREEPDPARAALYRELYPVWSDLRGARAAVDGAAVGYWLRGIGAAVAAQRPPATASFRPRILVTANLDDRSLEALSAVGEVVDSNYRKRRGILKGDALLEALAGFHVLVTEIDVVEAKVLVAARDLRLLEVCRGDAVNVDLEAATALGIPVLHTPGRNADAVADLTLAFFLMLARKLVPAAAYLRDPGQAGDMGRMGRAYGQLRGRELWRKTVGLVGLGSVGRKVVERLRPFGARCLVFDPFLDPDQVRLAGAEPAALDDLLRASDFVSLHAAVTDASRGLIGARELALMRPTSCLVNTARAALLDEEALAEALRSRRLAGAALDVFTVEPPGSDHPLVVLPNVISTPHVGGNTEDIPAHQGAIVAEELARVARGEPPRFALNRAALAGFDWSRARPEPDPELVKGLGQGPAPAVTDLQRQSQPRPR